MDGGSVREDESDRIQGGRKRGKSGGQDGVEWTESRLMRLMAYLRRQL